MQCKDCGLGRTETSGFDPAAYYTEDYFSGRHSDGYSDYLGAEPVLRREFARSVEFIRSYRRDGKLLELGCAYGFFLMEAARHFDVAGIELAEDAAAHGRRAGLKVVQGMADEANLRQIGHVDVIVLFDVIEHLPDPRETLALCHRQLNPGGIIVITTGDFGSMVAKLAGVRWRLMTPPQHLWFFTQESMRRMSARSGVFDGACGSPLEDRSGLADRLPTAAHARNAPGQQPAPVAWGYRSTCSTPCVSCCERRRDRRPFFALPQIALGVGRSGHARRSIAAEPLEEWLRHLVH